MNLCLFGASSADIDTLYVDAIRELGRSIAGRGHTLVFGGGATGLMARRSEASVKAGAMSQA